MEIFKQPYEISLWQDALVFVGSDGTIYDDITKMQDVSVVSQFYKEFKLCAIGSDSMESLARCVNPKLTRKVNGENQLVFTMYYRYQDYMTGEEVENPFIQYMCNERKVKLRLGAVGDPNCQWFDFIVKNTQENSESKAFTYTCKDQFVNELSKSGFEIELDNELENNLGTIDVLANTILKGSDWELDLTKTEFLKQYIEEPLYEIVLKEQISAKTMEKQPVAGEGEQILEKSFSADSRILVFYSQVVDAKEEIQFLYSNEINQDNELVFSADDDLVIDKTKYPNWIATVDLDSYIKSKTLSKYRGERLVRQILTEYDATIDKFVQVYAKEGDTENKYYGFTETEYSTSGGVQNYVANPSNFISTSGWQTDAHQLDYQIQTWPMRALEPGETYQSFLTFENESGALVMNAGIGGNRSAIEKFEKDERYALRMKYKTAIDGEYQTSKPKSVQIGKYHLGDETEGENEGKYVIDKIYFNFGNQIDPPLTNDIDADGNYISPSQDYIYLIADCEESVSKTELTDWDFKIGLFFEFEGDGIICIEDVEVFPYRIYEDEGQRLCVPNGKFLSEIKTKYYYYKRNPEWQSMADFKPIETSYAPIEGYIQVYGANSLKDGTNEFIKVRSISAKESNRFNLIQQLCETFECWPRFRVERDMATGQIELDENYRQKKFLSFHEYTGDDNPVGFRYGVNSKSIQRTVDSANIVTKMIVKDNANEFAPNGFCSIARASENPTGENFLLNFEQYYRHGLLDRNIVTNDLYVNDGKYLGYYTQLKALNADRNRMIDEQAIALTNISRYDSAYTTYKTSHDSAEEERLSVAYETSKYVGKVNYRSSEMIESEVKEINADSFEELVLFLLDEPDSAFGDKGKYYQDPTLNSYWTKWCQCKNIISQHGDLYRTAETNLKAAKNSYDNYAANLKELTDQKRQLSLRFYKKYSRFIQEGSWIKEDYTDPNLYYLDATSTLHTSAQPKVTYSISVIDVEPLGQQPQYSGFEHYHFDIGDKTFVEDIEFFGRSLHANGAPYREEVVVSEISMELDSPEKTQIKVQNYKNQFEDLFQRITAATQQAEYHTGEYNRAASVVEPDGTISVSAIQASLESNSMRLANAHDQSVVWDSSGITATNLHNPSEMVRIISGGIFLSNDGGQSWKTGITGGGINTAYLTAGQINTNEIYIMNGNNAAFRWDAAGLSAFASQTNGTYNKDKFVRFNEFGIFGAVGENEDFSSTEKIHENARFALTWDGFSLQNKYGDYSVGIDHENDIFVREKKLDEQKVTLIERVKIGRLYNESYEPVELDSEEDFRAGEFYVEVGGVYTRADDYDADATYYEKTEAIYGLSLKDGDNKTVMETGSDGQLWIKSALAIGEGEDRSVELGVLDNNLVFRAGSNFSVSKDGVMTATAGQIGQLLIKDNAFAIKNEDGNPVSVLTVKDHNLIVNGQINALEGGNIGGFIINDGILVSKDGAIELDGSNGKIVANNITLGVGAEISNYIQLGSAKLQNPTNPANSKKERPFIEAGEVKVFDTGKVTIGGISMDGAESKISGTNFSITPNRAEFSNVYVSGEIETSVFKKNSVQAAGGAMIFRPSYKIEENLAWSGTTLKVSVANDEITENLQKSLIGNTVWVVGSDTTYNKAKIIEVDGTSVRFEFDSKLEEFQPKLFIDLGKNAGYYLTNDEFPIEGKTYYLDLEGKDSIIYSRQDLIVFENEQISISGILEDGMFVPDVPKYEFSDGQYGFNLSDKYEYIPEEAIIGINSGNGSIGNVKPCGLTITSLSKDGPSLFLGDLSKMGDQTKYSGHGLYADNVYLNGSLTTKSTAGKYAGVNTLNGVTANSEIDPSQSNIIFWAGAVDSSDAAVRQAPFQVTEAGYVYVKNSIFAGGSITGADIYAARIHGTSDTDGAALTIYDAYKGISFARDYKAGQTATEVFSISQNGFNIGEGQSFIKFENNQAILKTCNEENYLSMQEIDEIPTLLHHHLGKQKSCGLYFAEGKTDFRFTEMTDSGSNTTIAASFAKNKVSFNQMVEFAKDNIKMQYKTAGNGYDLYVVS